MKDAQSAYTGVKLCQEQQWIVIVIDLCVVSHAGLVSVVKLAAAKQRLQRALDTAQQLKLDLSVT